MVDLSTVDLLAMEFEGSSMGVFFTAHTAVPLLMTSQMRLELRSSMERAKRTEIECKLTLSFQIRTTILIVTNLATSKKQFIYTNEPRTFIAGEMRVKCVSLHVLFKIRR